MKVNAATGMLWNLVESAILDYDTRAVWFPKSQGFENRRFKTLPSLIKELDIFIHVQAGIEPLGFRDRPGFGFYPDYDDNLHLVVQRILADSWIPAFLSDVSSLPQGDLIVNLDEWTVRGCIANIEVDFRQVNEHLIRYLAKHPEQMYELNPRRFEELVAALLEDMEYEVILTPPTKDGGVDIKAFRKMSYGTILTLVQCKRYSREQRVGVGVIRELHGVVDLESASHGLIATTAFFTGPAKALQEQVPFKVSLSDYDVLVSWCRNYRRKRG